MKLIGAMLSLGQVNVEVSLSMVSIGILSPHENPWLPTRGGSDRVHRFNPYTWDCSSMSATVEPLEVCESLQGHASPDHH